MRILSRGYRRVAQRDWPQDKCRRCPFIIYHRMIILNAPDDLGLEVLLEIDGSIIDKGSGYWIKIEAWRGAGQSAFQLLEDFFRDVDRVLQEIRQR